MLSDIENASKNAMRGVHIFLTIYLPLDGSTNVGHRSSTKGQLARQMSGENGEKTLVLIPKQFKMT